MHKLQADFKIVTPIFMSGANQDDVELRPPSIKGVLRFWWRALAYSKFDNKMEDLHKEEEKLFGSTRTSIKHRDPCLSWCNAKYEYKRYSRWF